MFPSVHSIAELASVYRRAHLYAVRWMAEYDPARDNECRYDEDWRRLWLKHSDICDHVMRDVRRRGFAAEQAPNVALLVYRPDCPICDEPGMTELIDLHGERFYSCDYCGAVLTEDDIIRADERSADILNIQDESREFVWDDPDVNGYAPGDYQDN